jgi:hypothetical protein
MTYIASLPNPTLELHHSPTIRTIEWKTEIADRDGYNWNATICYNIIEETREVTDYAVIFELGCGPETFESIKESVQEVIEGLEGHKLEFINEMILE